MSDIDIALVDSLKALDPKPPIREADVIKEAANCGGLTFSRQLAASAKAGSLIAAIVSFSA